MAGTVGYGGARLGTLWTGMAGTVGRVVSRTVASGQVRWGKAALGRAGHGR